MLIMDGCVIYRSNTHRDRETVVVFKLVLYNHKSLKKGRQLFLDSNIRIRAEIWVFSPCIHYCALYSLMYACMHPRTNVLCQHPKTSALVNKYVHIRFSISASSHVCMIMTVCICLRTYVKHCSTFNEGETREMHHHGSCLRATGSLCVSMCFCVSASMFMCPCMCCESPALHFDLSPLSWVLLYYYNTHPFYLFPSFIYFLSSSLPRVWIQGQYK
jgi:hypothetical protein